MKKLIHFLESLVCPSVDTTLNTFQNKINALNNRINHNVYAVNAADARIDELHDKKQVLLLDIVKAENAVEALEKITG